MSSTPWIYYLHGFNSSPQSTKAGILRDHLSAEGLIDFYRVPHLPYAFDQAIELLESEFQGKSEDEVVLIGSSLGGFYSTYLTERFGFKSALINPAVEAPQLLATLIGENENIYTGEKYILTQAHIDALAKVDCQQIAKPDRYFVLLQTADETLDYRKAERLYQSCKLDIEEGGSHSFEDFSDKLQDIFNFLLK